MARKSKGARWGLGEPYTGMLADWCTVNHNAPEREVVKEALETYIEGRLANEPVMRQRFDAARLARLKKKDVKLEVVNGKDEPTD